jgi:hypothetical protein
LEVSLRQPSIKLRCGPYGSRHRLGKYDGNKEFLWVEVVFPRLVHDAKEAAGSGIPIWNSFIQPTHEE